MKTIILGILIAFCSVPFVDARTCEVESYCETSGVRCGEAFKRFASYTEFQTWLNANPGTGFWVAHSTATIIMIVYETDCRLANRCIDAQGICTKEN